MLIRRYRRGEEKILWKLFFNTVRTVNIADYSKEQVEAWAVDKYPGSIWRDKIESMNPFVAVIEGVIVGYSSLDSSGYIDHFYCHHAYQRHGVGKGMMENILAEAKNLGVKKLTTHSSITAKKFFEHYRFTVVKEQLVSLRGQQLKNYIMELSLDN